MSKGKNKFKSPIRAHEISESTPSRETGPQRKMSLRGRNTTLVAILLIVIAGVAVYGSSLSNNFLGDDSSQIIQNVPVHSLSNIRTFFEGGTFYNGKGLAPLTGYYYRPLMTTAFSLMYAIAGPQPFAFHAFQLFICILSAIVLFLVLRYFFASILALALSLIFLIHPINSEVVFSIAALQDALFFLFGILAIWTLLRFQDASARYLILTAALLGLSLLSKESGILFVVMALVYAYMANRKRFNQLALLSCIVFGVYLLLKVHAVGLLTNPHNAPIDTLSLVGRIVNIPAIIWFYFAKFVFPINLAHNYQWVHKGISFGGFLIPLLLDLAVGAAIGYLALLLHQKSSQRSFVLFIFFSTWLGLGLLLHLQIIPLDMTVSETWFYFPMVGLLGMIGTLIDAFPPRINAKWVVGITFVILCTLGARTIARASNWHDQITLATHDIKVSKEDFNSDNEIAYDLATHSNFVGCKTYADRSLAIYPEYLNYNTLGLCLVGLRQYSQAEAAYVKGIRYQGYYVLYEDLAQLIAVVGNPPQQRAFMLLAVQKFPQDASLWMDLAIFDNRYGNNVEAKSAIAQAYRYGLRNDYIYSRIMGDQPLRISINPVPQ